MTLSVSNLSFSHSRQPSLDGINATFEAGKLSVILGPNGAGKSRILNCICGYYQPSIGSIELGGSSLVGLRPDQIAHLGVARVFQRIELFRRMTVLENIKLGSHSRLKSGLFDSGIYYGAARREEIALRNELERDVIDFLELDHIRNLHVATLPYGLQKRVELARALALQPKVLLLDEPFGMLDSLTRGELQDILIEIWNKEKITAVMITHDVDEAIFLADRVVMMTSGPRAKIGDVLDINFERPRTRKAVLEHDDYYKYRKHLIDFLEH